MKKMVEKIKTKFSSQMVNNRCIPFNLASVCLQMALIDEARDMFSREIFTLMTKALNCEMRHINFCAYDCLTENARSLLRPMRAEIANKLLYKKFINTDEFRNLYKNLIILLNPQNSKLANVGNNKDAPKISGCLKLSGSSKSRFMDHARNSRQRTSLPRGRPDRHQNINEYMKLARKSVAMQELNRETSEKSTHISSLCPPSSLCPTETDKYRDEHVSSPFKKSLEVNVNVEIRESPSTEISHLSKTFSENAEIDFQKVSPIDHNKTITDTIPMDIEISENEQENIEQEVFSSDLPRNQESGNNVGSQETNLADEQGVDLGVDTELQMKHLDESHEAKKIDYVLVSDIEFSEILNKFSNIDKKELKCIKQILKEFWDRQHLSIEVNSGG